MIKTELFVKKKKDQLPVNCYLKTKDQDHPKLFYWKFLHDNANIDENFALNFSQHAGNWKN